jgi:hypothetical protein
MGRHALCHVGVELARLDHALEPGVDVVLADVGPGGGANLLNGALPSGKARVGRVAGRLGLLALAGHSRHVGVGLHAAHAARIPRWFREHQTPFIIWGVKY